MDKISKDNVLFNQAFLQLSNDGSGKDNDGMDDDTKVLTVFLLNVIGCIICCLALQAIIILSKKTNAELINLRKNYKNFIEFKKLSDLKRTYSREQHILANKGKENINLIDKAESEKGDAEENGEE